MSIDTWHPNARIGLDAINARVERQAERFNVRYMDKLEFLCSADRSSCDVLDDSDNLLLFDYGHWTLEGARHFGAKMAEIGFLDGLSTSGGG